jgi:hypothetical protein
MLSYHSNAQRYNSEDLDLKQLLDCRPVRRRPGRPLKRLQAGHNREAEIGHFFSLTS